MTQVHYDLPAGPELGVQQIHLEALDLGDGIAELREHCALLPLAPLDRVRVNAEQTIVDIVALHPQFVYEIAFAVPMELRTYGARTPADHPALTAVNALVDVWQRSTYVTRTSQWTVLVSSQSESWLRSIVEHAYVDTWEPVRRPDLAELRLDRAPWED